MSFRPCPKPTNRQKRRRKPIARKARFRRYDNEFKVYKTDPPAIIRLKAEQCRAEQRAANNLAEWRFAGILRQLKIAFEFQVIFYVPDAVIPRSYIVVDFIVEGHKVAFEVDGKCHQTQIRRDAGRDLWLAGQGYRTVRIPARDVFHKRTDVALLVKRELGL